MYLFIGVGQAGSNILDELYNDADIGKVSKAIAINSGARDMMQLNKIKKEDWIGISRDLDTAVPGTMVGFAEKVTGGYGNDTRTAAKDAEEIVEDIGMLIQKKVPPGKVNFAVVMFSLGGGTGAGFGPFIAEWVRENYMCPVIPLVIFPSSFEGKQRHSNTLFAMDNLYERFNSFIVFDNNVLTHTRDKKQLYEVYKDSNRLIAASLKNITIGVVLEGRKVKGEEYPVLDYRDFLRALGMPIDESKGNDNYISTFGFSIYVYNILEKYKGLPKGNPTELMRSIVNSAMKQKMLNTTSMPTQMGCIINVGKKVANNIKWGEIASELKGNAKEERIYEGVGISNNPSIKVTSLFTYRKEDINDRINEIKKDAGNPQNTPSEIIDL